MAEADGRKALAHATPVLFACGRLVVGWLWLEQAVVAHAMLERGDDGVDASYVNGRIRACRYFAEAELPQVAVWLAPVIARSDLVFAAPVEEF